MLAKIGGSCLTDKTHFETLRAQVLDAIASQIGLVMQDDNVSLVIVHGRKNSELEAEVSTIVGEKVLPQLDYQLQS